MSRLDDSECFKTTLQTTHWAPMDMKMGYGIKFLTNSLSKKVNFQFDVKDPDHIALICSQRCYVTAGLHTTL